MTRASFVVMAVTVVGCLAFAPQARAADAADKASAEALYDQGRQLMETGKFDEACPKFEASQRLDPGVGTMLFLADCYEKIGRLASAWAEFREVVSAAHNAGSLDRERIAKQRADALEPRLAYLTIVPWRGQSVTVMRDGARVDEALMGAPIPVDPGKHVVAATAPGKREWSTSVQVTEGSKVSVSVPILPDDSSDGTVAPPAAGSGASTAPADTGGGGSSQKTFALVAGGVGVVGLAVGTIFGLTAQSSWSDAKAKCGSYPDDCGQESADLEDDARGAATVSTIGFVVGVAGVAGGAVLWFTAPDSSSDTGVAVGVGPGQLRLNGRF